MSQKTSLMKKHGSLNVTTSAAHYTSPAFKKKINIFKLNDVKKIKKKSFKGLNTKTDIKKEKMKLFFQEKNEKKSLRKDIVKEEKNMSLNDVYSNMVYKKKNQGNKIINNESDSIKDKESNINKTQKNDSDNLSIKKTKLDMDKIKLKYFQKKKSNITIEHKINPEVNSKKEANTTFQGKNEIIKDSLFMNSEDNKICKNDIKNKTLILKDVIIKDELKKNDTDISKDIFTSSLVMDYSQSKKSSNNNNSDIVNMTLNKNYNNDNNSKNNNNKKPEQLIGETNELLRELISEIRQTNKINAEMFNKYMEKIDKRDEKINFLIEKMFKTQNQ